MMGGVTEVSHIISFSPAHKCIESPGWVRGLLDDLPWLSEMVSPQVDAMTLRSVVKVTGAEVSGCPGPMWDITMGAPRSPAQPPAHTTHPI